MPGEQEHERPLAHGPRPEEHHALADGRDPVWQRERRGVELLQQAQGQVRVDAHRGLDGVHAGVGLGQPGGGAQPGDRRGAQLGARELDRLAEEVALEQVRARRGRPVELVLVFDLLGDDGQPPLRERAHQALGVGPAVRPHVDLDEVGDVEERRAARAGREVVQRDRGTPWRRSARSRSMSAGEGVASSSSSSTVVGGASGSGSTSRRKRSVTLR